MSSLRLGHRVAWQGDICIYRVSISSFPDYKYLQQENYVEYKDIFFSKCNSTQDVSFYNTHTSNVKKNMFVFHVVFL